MHPVRLQHRSAAGVFGAVFETNDRSNERVAPSFNIRDISVAELAIRKRLADGGHVDPKAALSHGDVRPNVIDELFIFDDLAWTLDEIDQKIESPTAEGKRDTVAPQHPFATRKFKRSKSQYSLNAVARHSLLMLFGSDGSPSSGC